VDIYTSKDSLIGWWRLGETKTEVQLASDATTFANSAPGYSSTPQTLYDHGTAASMSTSTADGDAPALGAAGDGALMNYKGSNRLSSGGDYGTTFGQNNAWTMAAWIAPGYLDDNPAPTQCMGHIMGPLTMDGSGSWNIGVGLLWDPYYNDPDSAAPGGVLHLFRKNNGVGFNDDMTIPWPFGRFFYGGSAGAASRAWAAAKGYTVGAVTPPEMKIPAIGSSDPWGHVAITYDGTTIKAYINGVKIKQMTSTGDMGSAIDGEDFNIFSARIDHGVSEYDGEFPGAMDEVAVWSECLTAAEVLTVYQAGGGGVTGTSDWASYQVGGSDLSESFWTSREISAKMYAAGAQTVNDATLTALLFDSISYDTQAIVDTANDRFTVADDSRYKVTLNVSWVANATGFRHAQILLNGTIVARDTNAPGSAAIVGGNSVTVELDLVEGDDLTFKVHHTKGGTLDATATASISRIT
jgi:hypothetical protein